MGKHFCYPSPGVTGRGGPKKAQMYENKRSFTIAFEEVRKEEKVGEDIGEYVDTRASKFSLSLKRQGHLLR